LSDSETHQDFQTRPRRVSLWLNPPARYSGRRRSCAAVVACDVRWCPPRGVLSRCWASRCSLARKA